MGQPDKPRAGIPDKLLARCRRSSRAVQTGAAILTLWAVAVGLAVTGFMLLYLIKCALGIDLFPDKHLRDFLCF